MSTPPLLNIAVVGCSHGEMDAIYGTLNELEKEKGYKFDLLLCCGDFQALRNCGDLRHMHCPEKFWNLKTFYKYYSGEKEAPVLTIFIGGNHESTGYLKELPNGGWAAKNIYFMGHSNVIQFAGLRIGGLSGIFKSVDYDRGYFERPPFAKGAIVSAYHVRNVDVLRLKNLTSDSTSKTRVNALDIMLSHDWPSGVTDHGDVNKLLAMKPYFREDIQNCKLGNPNTMNLLYATRPNYWFSAHLHCKFAALVTHKKGEEDKNSPEPTRFLALDKPIRCREFLQTIRIRAKNDRFQLEYDPTWLAILKNTDHLTKVSTGREAMPGKGTHGERWNFFPTEEEVQEALQLFGNDLKIPENFKMTAPPHREGEQEGNVAATPYYLNPQSTEFCSKLGIKSLNKLLFDMQPDANGTPYCDIPETEEIAIPNDDDAEEDVERPVGELEGVEGLFSIDTDPTGFAPPPIRGISDQPEAKRPKMEEDSIETID
ncbi:hypothetical protein L596_009733 [Steinernema carpocapsae]|uniref:Lariat debranching enzyme C-terminal domain-containing protein n=1 Tax=Steinernema carpocapsae TaxID=34508 RepID=A0A4U5PG69_STECR|nr:hypothetical protein L596_009733 [Steinernema carpocapsae]